MFLLNRLPYAKLNGEITVYDTATECKVTQGQDLLRDRVSNAGALQYFKSYSGLNKNMRFLCCFFVNLVLMTLTLLNTGSRTARKCNLLNQAS